MRKLKIILLFSTIIYVFLCIKYNFYKSKYGIDSEVIGTITSIEYSDNKTSFIVKGKEKVLLNYYEENKFNIGDKVKVIGELKSPSINTTKNLFNYRNYLKSQKIYWIINNPKITLLKRNNNIFYKVKNYLINKINNEYLYSFILGDNSYIDDEIINSYRKNGISHLFAISGMHITLITSILLYLFGKVFDNKNIIILIISVFLLLYMFLVGFTPSVIRAILLFIILNFSKSKAKDVIVIIACILLLINPYYIYDLGFKYSFIVSYYLINYNKLFNKNYIYNLFLISLIAFLASLPIQVNNFFEINLFSIVNNMVFVPLVSIIIFPFTLITFIFSFLEPVLNIMINILENLSLFFSRYSYNIIIPKIPLVLIIFYYFILLKLNKFKIILLVTFLVLYPNMRYFINNYAVTFIDVGQGDSILINYPYNTSNILIDTGGSSYNKSNYISNNIIIPCLKSIGINKLDYLIITHGDYDHMGEAIDLVENFKVEKVIFNCGEFNELEQELIKILDKKKISYYICIKELNIDDNKLYFLNNELYDNENDNSSVIYTELNNHKFLFMGDAGVEVEDDIIEKYNLKNIDVLKVGHHGSKTSTSKEFIDEINPKYGVISVGKNNRYEHPNKEVLDKLKYLKIYRTDIDGSVIFKIKNDKLKIETCSL